MVQDYPVTKRQSQTNVRERGQKVYIEHVLYTRLFPGFLVLENKVKSLLYRGHIFFVEIDSKPINIYNIMLSSTRY